MKYLLDGEETERLHFRLPNDNDFDAWLYLFTDDKNAAKFLGLNSLKTPEEQCKAWFEKSKYRLDNDLGGMNALVDKPSGKLVGYCGLLVQEVDNNIELEVGYSIIPAYQGKGYASEAAKKCRDYAFSNNFSNSLISIIHPENIGSQKVAQNNGMTLLKSTTFKDSPANIYGITKREWENIK